MSQAFVKDEDGQWLHDLPPTMNALVNYLTRENNGVRVYETKSLVNAEGIELHQMSNGLSYYINKQKQWAIAW